MTLNTTSFRLRGLLCRPRLIASATAVKHKVCRCSGDHRACDRPLACQAKHVPEPDGRVESKPCRIMYCALPRTGTPSLNKMWSAREFARVLVTQESAATLTVATPRACKASSTRSKRSEERTEVARSHAPRISSATTRSAGPTVDKRQSAASSTGPIQAASRRMPAALCTFSMLNAVPNAA